VLFRSPVNIKITEINITNNLITKMNTGSTIDRGKTGFFSITDLPNSNIRSKETFEIIITFKRESGSREYELKGTAILKPVPPLI